MTAEKKVVHCAAHGERPPAFVCRHLVKGSGLGFFEPDEDGAEGDEWHYANAWCAACEAMRAKEGGWNDVSEPQAGVTMVCSGCFDDIWMRNRKH